MTSNLIYNKICKAKKCKNYIEWGIIGTGDCVSCKLIGQSYDIDHIPDKCPYIEDLKDYEKEQNQILINQRIKDLPF